MTIEIYMNYVAFVISLRRIKVAFEDFQTFLDTEVANKKRELKTDVQFDGSLSVANKSVFARLVRASEQEGPVGLDHRELIGNLFIFLFAGVRFPCTFTLKLQEANFKLARNRCSYPSCYPGYDSPTSHGTGTCT